MPRIDSSLMSTKQPTFTVLTPLELIDRIYEVFPLVCPMCGGQMWFIAFITEGAQIRKILEYIGVDSEPPHRSLR